MIVAELKKLSRLEVDEKFLHRQVIKGNKKAELPLGANQAQQKAVREYIEFLGEQYAGEK